jgi:hypothetical protein
MDLGVHQARTHAGARKEMRGSLRASRDCGASHRRRCRGPVAIVARVDVCNLRGVTRAREKLGELHAFEAKKYVDPETFADIHAILGEVRWYRKAFEDRSPDMAFAQVGSRLNPRLAADAGFRAILDQMAFPTSAK